MDVRPSIDLEEVARTLGLPRPRVSAAVALLDAGNTVPFITRYRKDQTGGLDEEQIREIQARVTALRLLADRKQTILRSIESQGKLTADLAEQIRGADSTRVLEDLYLPFKPKKQTLATSARDRGLEPLAQEILNADAAATDLDARAGDFVNPDHQIGTPAEALLGAGHILAEWFSERAELRQQLRVIVERSGVLSSARIEGPTVDATATVAENEPPPLAVPAEKSRRNDKAQQHEKLTQQFRDYFNYREPVGQAPPHRVLAINRGERAKILRVKIEIDRTACESAADESLAPAEHPHREFLRGCARDTLDRLILPSLERELRRELTEFAEQHAVSVFARNLRSLLLQPPIRGKRVLAIDPGFKSGCKLAALDEFGAPLANEVIHIIGSAEKRAAARAKLLDFIRQHQTPIIAIGNGTACRQTEELVAEILMNDIKDEDVAYCIVNEAGASVYSASPLGREEFPQFDATLRGTISIGRRLQDPLSELVKIEPGNIGVGMYQHDVKAKHLRDTLDGVVESCVNYVGVDVNSASPALMRYVSGLNQLTARRVFEHRVANGPFTNREQLKQVSGFGDVAYTQSAGFLKIAGGDQPLDATWIHPESYAVAQRVLEKLGCSLETIADKAGAQALANRLNEIDRDALAQEVSAGRLTLDDILANLTRPGRDPRDDLPLPVFKHGILKLEDVEPGMELAGTVLNVVDFGAFVDVGLSERGLVHISQMAGKFVASPHELLSVGDTVRVWVLGVDRERRRVSLSMISPQQRAERERPQRERTQRPPRRKPAAAVQMGQPASADGSQNQGSGRPSHGSSGQSGRRDNRRHQQERPRRPARPKPPVKLTSEMKEGKEPVYSFAALKQLLELRSQEQPAESSGDKPAS